MNYKPPSQPPESEPGWDISGIRVSKKPLTAPKVAALTVLLFIIYEASYNNSPYCFSDSYSGYGSCNLGQSVLTVVSGWLAIVGVIVTVILVIRRYGPGLLDKYGQSK